MSDFHPLKNLPSCMMPDGGECCAGHAAVVEDWHRQRAEIKRLRRDRITAKGDAQQFKLLRAEVEIERLREKIDELETALYRIQRCVGDIGEIAKAVLRSEQGEP